MSLPKQKQNLNQHLEDLSNDLHCDVQQRDATKRSVQQSHQEPRQDRASQEHHSPNADSHCQTSAGLPAQTTARILPLHSLHLQGTAFCIT